MNISETIKKLRKEYGLTQADLAKKVRVSRATISHWENGYCAPTLKDMVTIAEMFDKTVCELVGQQCPTTPKTPHEK